MMLLVRLVQLRSNPSPPSRRPSTALADGAVFCLKNGMHRMQVVRPSPARCATTGNKPLKRTSQGAGQIAISLRRAAVAVGIHIPERRLLAPSRGQLAIGDDPRR